MYRGLHAVPGVGSRWVATCADLVLILLPPSEGKAGGGRGRALDLDRLSFPELGPTRRKVSSALAEVSARSDATDVLGVSSGLASDVARNLELGSAPTRAASRMYSGVLYEALDVAGMSPDARRRANRWIVITSALFGAVRLSDPIVPYRLSMSVNLPGVGPLAPAWRAALVESLADAAGSRGHPRLPFQHVRRCLDSRG